MAGDETEDKELLNGEGNEAEADAGDQGEQDEVGDEDQGSADESLEQEEVAAAGDGEKPRSRGETRFQKLANEAREAREESAKVRRELDEFRAQQSRPQVQQESPDQVAQRLALMTPEERLEYKFDQQNRQNQQTLQGMQFQMRDTSDKSAFLALCASNATAARYKDRVEAKLAEVRRAGQNVDREALFKFMVGEDVVNRGPAVRAKQAKDGERRLQRQTVTPGNSRGDNAPNKRGGQTLEEKLENVTF